MKRKAAYTMVVVLIVTVAASIGIVYFPSMPCSGPDHIVVGPKVLGVRSGRTHAYIVHQNQRAVLIDAGSDKDAPAIVSVLKTLQIPEKNVDGILLTSGHKEHWAGAKRFPNAPVWVSKPDHALVRGKKKPKGAVAKYLARFSQHLKPPSKLRVILPGALINAGGFQFHAIKTPSRSAGSMMYACEQWLFSGSSMLVAKDELRPPPWYLKETKHDPHLVWLRLKPVEFNTILDAYGHVANDGRKLYEQWLCEKKND